MDSMFQRAGFNRNIIQAVMVLTACVRVAYPDDTQGIHYFEKHVRPLLVDRCLKCHSAGSETLGGNLRLDSQEGWSKGGDLGPALVPGKPEKSLIIGAVNQSSDGLEMPPSGRLSKHEISILVNWVKMGAPDPRTAKSESRPTVDIELGKKFWAFQPHHGQQILPPSEGFGVISENEIDRFIQAQQQRAGLKLSPPVDRLTLIRRVTFGLVGLPPSPEEVERFVKDSSAGSLERLIDRLLSSPRYGEVWGRHWLDVARYADSNGLDENIAHGNAWRYRDYVIRSFNRDKPFSRFVQEQIAGDLLPASDHDFFSEEWKDSLIATGFLSLGPKVLAEVDQTKMEMDIVDEQVDTVGRAFMAITLGCARCHDHKFDPISTEDYYAMAGIFKSTKTMEHFKKIARWNEVSIANPAQEKALNDHARKLQDTKRQLEQVIQLEKEQANTDSVDKLPTEAISRLNLLREAVKSLESSKPELPTAMAVTEYEKPMDLHVHIRGNHLTQGKLVLRGFPSALAGAVMKRPRQSGRLDLADWLIDPQHPLVARVIVNRIWRWHFGRGIVESTDNFGKLGSLPSHPELLDWLANRLVENGWSIKSLHRLILTSRTYQQSSQKLASYQEIDADNRLIWRSQVKRLGAESIRDSLLAVSGQLDLTMGGSQLHVKNREFLFDHTSKDLTSYDAKTRSVYLPVVRNHLYDVFQLFDYADASVASSHRAETTVAPQALFMMNSKLVTAAAAGLRDRLFKHADEPFQRHRLAYQIAFARFPLPSEKDRDMRFIEQLGAGDISEREAWKVFCQALLMSNEFIYIR
ncbi:MAG: PSD1 and planctomycete cytochrome C domain-containing protein [Planctomycetota bacterium]|nr:PSD1 and planctomycete cytochrome C domain-containing protein [Planctomycetota bacterium]